MNVESLDDRSLDTAGAIARAEHRPVATVDKHPCPPRAFLIRGVEMESKIPNHAATHCKQLPPCSPVCSLRR